MSERPQIVNKHKWIGNIEVNLMMGKNHKSALLVMKDRTTLGALLKELPENRQVKVALK
jgi:IS30 family transposase